MKKEQQKSNEYIALDYFESLNEDEQIKLLNLFELMGNIGVIKNETKFRNEGEKIYAFKLLAQEIIMNKPLSTFERKMQDKKFKQAYEQSYKELLFSELLISIMDADDKSVRGLAEEAQLSPSVIQDLRSGKQNDIKVSNLINIAKAFGYEVILQKGKEKLTLHDEIKNKKHHLSVVACA